MGTFHLPSGLKLPREMKGPVEPAHTSQEDGGTSGATPVCLAGTWEHSPPPLSRPNLS